jgi:hypothetical protein
MVAAMAEDQMRELAQEVIGDVAGMLNDIRPTMRLSGSILGGLTLGIALEAALAPSPLGHGAGSVAVVVLLICLIVSWLRAATLLVMAGRPVLGIVSDHHWEAGTALDPRAPWLTLPRIDATPQEWTWVRAHLLVGAARIRMTRTQSALTWIAITTGFFLFWTASVILTH